MPISQITSASIATNTITSDDMSSTAQYYGFKNRIINGAMVIDQRNAGASVATTTIVQNVYTLDRWAYNVSAASKFTVQQNAGAVTPPVGFTKYLGCTSASAYTVGTGEYFLVDQLIEGQNVSDLAWGTANAATVTLSFWVRSSLTGTFGGTISNSTGNRSYPFSYSIPVANTWTSITITIPGDTTGTWLTTNGLGIGVYFSLGAGASVSGTANTWASAFYASVTGATSVVGTNGATWFVTGVQLEKGSVATSFDYRPYGTELSLCQRYFWTTNGLGNPPIYNNLVGGTNRIPLPVNVVPMRTAATITYYTAAGATGSVTEFSSGTARVVSSTSNSSGIGGGYFQTSTAFANPCELRADFSAEL